MRFEAHRGVENRLVVFDAERVVVHLRVALGRRKIPPRVIIHVVPHGWLGRCLPKHLGVTPPQLANEPAVLVHLEVTVTTRHRCLKDDVTDGGDNVARARGAVLVWHVEEGRLERLRPVDLLVAVVGPAHGDATLRQDTCKIVELPIGRIDRRLVLGANRPANLSCNSCSRVHRLTDRTVGQEGAAAALGVDSRVHSRMLWREVSLVGVAHHNLAEGTPLSPGTHAGILSSVRHLESGGLRLGICR